MYRNLSKEIQENHSKIKDEKLNQQFAGMRQKFQRKIDTPSVPIWVGFDKTISIWTLINKSDTKKTDYYRYLSNNDFKNFMQHGYYEKIKDFEECLTLFYFYCEEVSIESQNLEKPFNYSPEELYSNYYLVDDHEKWNYLDNHISRLNSIIIAYRPLIEGEYEKLHPSLKTGLWSIIRMFMNL